MLHHVISLPGTTRLGVSNANFGRVDFDLSLTNRTILVKCAPDGLRVDFSSGKHPARSRVNQGKPCGSKRFEQTFTLLQPPSEGFRSTVGWKILCLFATRHLRLSGSHARNLTLSVSSVSTVPTFLSFSVLAIFFPALCVAVHRRAC